MDLIINSYDECHHLSLTRKGLQEQLSYENLATVILQCSIREGFGFTVTEAMWKNQPVVGTHVTGLQMQITHGVNGYLVDEADEAAMEVGDNNVVFISTFNKFADAKASACLTNDWHTEHLSVFIQEYMRIAAGPVKVQQA